MMSTIDASLITVAIVEDDAQVRQSLVARCAWPWRVI